MHTFSNVHAVLKPFSRTLHASLDYENLPKSSPPPKKKANFLNFSAPVPLKKKKGDVRSVVLLRSQ